VAARKLSDKGIIKDRPGGNSYKFSGKYVPMQKKSKKKYPCNITV